MHEKYIKNCYRFPEYRIKDVFAGEMKPGYPLLHFF